MEFVGEVSGVWQGGQSGVWQGGCLATMQPPWAHAHSFCVTLTCPSTAPGVLWPPAQVISRIIHPELGVPLLHMAWHGLSQ